HVLIIDDESTLRVALRRFFSRIGWRVTEASDGKEALALILESVRSRQHGGTYYDMVLSDVRMPGLNGMQLHARLSVERPDIVPRIVFSTGDVAGPEMAAFVSKAHSLIVHKPFQLGELQEIAEKLRGTNEREITP
ncbi:MAG: response regulator, partial [Gemmatimonadota bacterium]